MVKTGNRTPCWSSSTSFFRNFSVFPGFEPRPHRGNCSRFHRMCSSPPCIDRAKKRPLSSKTWGTSGRRVWIFTLFWPVAPPPCAKFFFQAGVEKVTPSTFVFRFQRAYPGLDPTFRYMTQYRFGGTWLLRNFRGAVLIVCWGPQWFWFG